MKLKGIKRVITVMGPRQKKNSSYEKLGNDDLGDLCWPEIKTTTKFLNV